MTIDNLLKIFDINHDAEELEYLNDSLSKLYLIDPGLYNFIIENLYYLKQDRPNFKIHIGSIETQYDGKADTIFIHRKQQNLASFFHELVHAMEFNTPYSRTPIEMREFLNNIINDPVFVSNSVSIINSFNDYIMELEMMNSKDHDPEIDEKVEVYGSALDILDAIFNGEAFDKSVNYIKDNSTNVEKSRSLFGHGEKYYKYLFRKSDEILADYGAIRCSKYKDEILEILKNALGEDFMSFLESYYLKIITYYSSNTPNNSNNNMNKL